MLPFPFGPVNRAIASFFGLGDAADAMRALAQAGAAGTQANDRLTDILFGLGGLGDVHLTSNTVGFSGLKDCETFTIDRGVSVSPATNQLLFIRARRSITWNGTWLADGVFQPNTGNLITLGSPAQSGSGGGGGGGNSGAQPGNQGNQGNDGFGNGGGGVGYLPGTGGIGGKGGNGGLAGDPGTAGAPGAIDPFQQNTILSEFPGVLAAMSGCQPGQQGQQGQQGGRGADVGGGAGNGGNQGQGGQNGGAAGGLLILATPSLILGPFASFQAQGLDGDPAPLPNPSMDGQPAPGGGTGNGGGGGGGSGGSGAQGGSGGSVLAYYATFADGGAVFLLTGGNGGAWGAGGAGGAGDGVGTTGGAGGAGARGPAGALGFFWPKKIITA